MQVHCFGLMDRGYKMEKNYSREIDGYRLGVWAKIGYIALGFLLGIIGILIDWAIGHRKKMMECSAEAIYLGIIGCALLNIFHFICLACGLTLYFSVVGMEINALSIFLLVVAILFIILSMMWVYGMRYKLTPAEKALTFHGDDWIKPDEKHLRYDSGITIEAPPEKIWPYVRQVGQDRAGWYSFDWLERLFTFHIHNHYDIHPEWQTLEPGVFQWFHQAPLSIGEWVTEASNDGPWYFASHSDSRTDPTYQNPGPNQEKALNLGIWKYFCWTWNWQLVPVDENRTRLLMRCDCTFAPYIRLYKYFVVFILGTASIVMGRNMLDVLKELIEGRKKYPDKKK